MSITMSERISLKFSHPPHQLKSETKSIPALREELDILKHVELIACGDYELSKLSIKIKINIIFYDNELEWKKFYEITQSKYRIKFFPHMKYYGDKILFDITL